MAIVVERIEGSNDLIKTYSDKGMMILQEQTGAIYPEAIDIDYAGYTYTETDIPIEEDNEEEEESSDSEILDILLGREDENNEAEDN